MKSIQLTQGQFSLVDDSDYHEISKYKWFARWCTHSKSFYAVRNSPRDTDKKRRHIIMHREIMKPNSGVVIDHINHDTLDNRRINLRQCSVRENGANQKLRSTNKSGFKGVHWCKNVGKWRAAIRVNGRREHIGLFTSAIDAAAAYDARAVAIHGEFALTNRKLGLV